MAALIFQLMEYMHLPSAKSDHILLQILYLEIFPTKNKLCTEFIVNC